MKLSIYIWLSRIWTQLGKEENIPKPHNLGYSLYPIVRILILSYKSEYAIFLEKKIALIIYAYF